VDGRSLQPPPTSYQRALYIPLIILAWLAVIVIGGWVLTHIIKTILTLTLSAIVAFALTPLVNFLSRWMPRGLAIALAYVLGFGVVLGLGALLVITAASQVTNLVGNLPHYVHDAQSHERLLVHLLRPFGVTAAKLHTAEHHITDYLQNIGTTAAKGSLAIITGVLGTVIDVILVLILSVYLTANGSRIARSLRRETPGRHRRYTILLIAIVNQVVGGYVRGTLTLASLIGFLVGVGMWILHVPYAVLLGILAFFMEFIPIIGVLVSGAVCIAIALLQGWITALLVLAYFVLVHIIEGDVVGPRIMGRAVGIHPATALIALVAGTELFGFWGALFGAPLAGLLQAIGVAAWREWRGGVPGGVVQAVEEKVQEQLQEQEKEEREPGATPLAQ